ncbi:MAG: CotH kinase family protein [Treponema sp.]|jgi:hypothetical protein|nr:CotH kinase family protein [Treponema sp.]
MTNSAFLLFWIASRKLLSQKLKLWKSLSGGLFSIFFSIVLLSTCQNSYSDPSPDPEVTPEVTKGYVDPGTLNTGLPVLKINTTDGQAILSKENYITADIQIIDPNNDSYCLETITEIRRRGNATWRYPKKPYRLKFFEKKSLFGLTKAKSWVLLANFQDPTLLMNTVAFELGNRMGLPYTNHYIHVELVLNDVYEGSYVLTEQVQVGKGRVDIDEDAGFLVELDVYYDEEPKFRTQNYRLPVMIKSPEGLSDISGYNFVINSINALDTRLYDGNFPMNGYHDLIKTDTFVDFLLINEIVGNGELGHPKSTYMYKDKDGKINMGPLWDFDWGYGYSGRGNKYFIQTDYRNEIHPFFNRLFDDPDFRTDYKTHWNANYSSIADIPNFIDEMAQKLELSQRTNYKVWQWSDGINYAHQIQRMKTWWNRRIVYLNNEINKPE